MGSSSTAGCRRRGMTAALAGFAAILLLAVPVPAALHAAELSSVDQEIVDALRESIIAGYRECNAEKVLSLYDSEAQIATFTRGVLDKDSFGSMLRETLAQNTAMAATLEVGAATIEGDEALVPLHLILEGTDAGGNRRVTKDRLFCRLRNRGTWKILMQTYRRDFTLPPVAPPGVHH